MSGDDHEGEVIPGLPEPLPPGEFLLWQGAPRWQTLAMRAFHLRKLAIYFSVLLAWYVVSHLWAGYTLTETVVAGAWIVPASLAALALVVAFAWLTSRTTIYTVTSRRVAMRIGIALSLTINIPFRVIASAQLRTNEDGTGDIILSLLPEQRIAYLVIWPHARPWRLARSQPMLRCIADAPAVAQTLARALAASAPGQPVPVAQPRPVSQPDETGPLVGAAA